MLKTGLGLGLRLFFFCGTCLEYAPGFGLDQKVSIIRDASNEHRSYSSMHHGRLGVKSGLWFGLEKDRVELWARVWVRIGCGSSSA